MNGHNHASQTALAGDLNPLMTALIAAQQQLQPQTLELPSNQPQTSIPSGSAPFLPSHHGDASAVRNSLLQWQHLQHQPQNGTGAFIIPSTVTAYAPHMQPLLNFAPHHNTGSQWVPSQYQMPAQPIPVPPRVNVQETSGTGVIASLISTLQTHLVQLQQQAPQQRDPLPSDGSSSLNQTHAQANSTPVGSTPDDEERLIDALRRCKNDGLNPRQALEGLHGVNDHNATAWKDYFLEHLHRLYASSRQPDLGESSSETRSRPSTSLRESSLQESVSPMTPQSLERHAPPVIPRRQNRMIIREEATRSEPVSALPPKALPASSTEVPLEYLRRSPGSVALPSAHRRDSSTTMTHAGIRVHLLRTSIKPTPPVWEENDGSRFTDAEKTFFIHYLHWRMHDAPTVSKDELYDELAQQLPHHNPSAWKRHWGQYPELPDRIYSEGRSDNAQSIRRSNEATDNDKQVGGSPSHTSDDTEENTSDSDSASSDDSCENPSVATTPRAPRPVTEADLRAMARHRVENRATWHLHTTQRARWREFASLPENATKRTVAGWVRIETSHPKPLQRYYEEYLAEAVREGASPAQGTASDALSVTPPPSTNGSRTGAGGRHTPQTSRKREATPRERYVPTGGGSPARKRQKGIPADDTMHQPIELSD